MKIKVAIIGGGAAGFMASIIASKNGADVTIYEKMNRVGKKILATGNGRCNYTNTNISIANYHGNRLDVVEKALEVFDMQNTINFFEDIGIYPYYDISGKVFPYSLQASSILDNLRYEAQKLGVKEIVDCEIINLRKGKGQFDIITNDKVYNADRVILCTGGKAGSQYGCTGDGYKLAESFGHKTIQPFPALVQLKLDANYLKRVSGVKFEGKATVLVNDDVLREELGEILFTDYGISGPPILQLSRKAIEHLNKSEEVYIVVDMFPNFSKHMLYDILHNRFIKLNGRVLEDSFNGLIHKKLIPVVLNLALPNYSDDKNLKPISQLNKKEIYSIVNILKEWKIKVIGSNGWQQAQTTAGGVSLDEIDVDTLESKRVKGLYFAGEIVDVDGDCGGFNLQWAWSSGYIAGKNAALKSNQ